jgi:coproporphyrinogen III oxidase-like Fe-S oxidoreductase
VAFAARLGFERISLGVGAFEEDLLRQIALLDNAIAQEHAGNAGLGVSQQ